MGLYDHIRCEHPLPDGFDGDLEYQTKDTDEQYLGHYTITAEGRLVHHKTRMEETPQADKPYPDAPFGSLLDLCGSVTRVPVGDEFEDFHGALNFYTSNWSGSGPNGYLTSDGQRGWTRDYTALFDHGRLLKIEGGIEYDEKMPVSREEFWRDPPAATGAREDKA